MPVRWPLLTLAAVALAGLAPDAATQGALSVEIEPTTTAINLAPNGSFEDLGADGRPTGWQFNAGQTDATLTVISPGATGQHAVRLTNSTLQAPHVYGSLVAGEIAVQPHTAYTLSCRVRSGAKVGTAWIGGGQGWHWRLSLPATNGEWRRIHQSWVTGDETTIPLLLVTEAPTDPIDIDDVQLEAGSQPSPFIAPGLDRQPTLLLDPPARTAADDGTLVAASWNPQAYPAGEWVFGAGDLLLEGLLSLPQRAAEAQAHIAIETPAGAGPTWQSAVGLPSQGRVRVRLALPAPAPDRVTVIARAFAGDVELARERRAVRIVTPAQVEALLADVEARLPAARAAAAANDGAAADLATVEWFVPWVREDLATGLVDRAYDAALQLGPVVQRAAASPPRPAAPRYVTSPLTIRNGAFEATVELADGTRAQRVVQFNGFGHFGTLRRMVAEMPRIGVNLIQVELGPHNVLTGPTEVNLTPLGDLVDLLRRAAAADVQVNVLVSPHYFPEWALEQWPDLRDFNGGFLRHAIHDARAKAILERFLRLVVPRLAAGPGLHSICLSNEPLVIDQSRAASSIALWHDWLRARYPSVDALNTAWGSAHRSFAGIPIPAPEYNASPLIADYNRFNQESFADWHRWMADIIHELAPAVPVHAKIMIGLNFEPTFNGPWSIAPELFAQLSQINGNDGHKWPHAQGEWANDWVSENMGYDYQRSAALLPVFNSENHLILDRYFAAVDPAHIRNVLWQGAVHGQGAQTTWVWERTNDRASDFAGSILHRPACVAEFGRTSLDLQRAAPELAALAAEPTPVAIFWSPRELLARRDHAAEVRTVYTALNFLDRPVGFVNERDLEALLAGEPNRALGAACLLIVPPITHPIAAFEPALAAWQAAGGRVLRLAADRADQPAFTGPARDWWTWLAPRVEAACGPALVPVGVWGVEARATRFEGRRLVNVCAYGREPVSVDLAPGTDLLTGARVGGPLTLVPLEPRLVALD